MASAITDKSRLNPCLNPCLNPLFTLFYDFIVERVARLNFKYQLQQNHHIHLLTPLKRNMQPTSARKPYQSAYGSYTPQTKTTGLGRTRTSLKVTHHV